MYFKAIACGFQGVPVTISYYIWYYVIKIGS